MTFRRAGDFGEEMSLGVQVFTSSGFHFGKAGLGQGRAICSGGREVLVLVCTALRADICREMWCGGGCGYLVSMGRVTSCEMGGSDTQVTMSRPV